MNPNEYEAVRTAWLFTMNPAASRINMISRKNKSRNKIQEPRIAATVKITVRMNHAHTYMASAWLNSGLMAPVVLSV